MSPSDVVSATVEVALDPATTFAVFTEEIGQWWRPGPLSWYDSGRAVGIRFEPGVGGRWLEVYDEASGDALEIGRITVWEPGARLVLLYRDGGYDLDGTEVEVRFEAIDGGTRVTLEHRGWERLAAELASKKRAIKRWGWADIMGWFKDWAFWGTPLAGSRQPAKAHSAARLSAAARRGRPRRRRRSQGVARLDRRRDHPDRVAHHRRRADACPQPRGRMLLCGRGRDRGQLRRRAVRGRRRARLSSCRAASRTIGCAGRWRGDGADHHSARRLRGLPGRVPRGRRGLSRGQDQIAAKYGIRLGARRLAFYLPAQRRRRRSQPLVQLASPPAAPGRRAPWHRRWPRGRPPRGASSASG